MSHEDDIATVEAINEQFYRVLERLDLDAMEALWAHDDEVRCVHPGWPALEGWPAVRESWRTIFANTERIRFELTDVQVVAGTDLAYVFLTENISSDDDGAGGATAVAATNVFRRQQGHWRMLLHHASPVPVQAEEPERGGGPIVLN